MTMKIVRSKEEFIEVAAKELFEDMRDTLHDLDKQASEAGVDDPQILMGLTIALATSMASYAAYITAGLYWSAGADDETVAGAMTALEADVIDAMKDGVTRALRVSDGIKKDTAKAQADTDALLKKVVKTWKN